MVSSVNVRCLLCEKTRDEVATLVTGTNANICDGCVANCVAFLASSGNDVFDTNCQFCADRSANLAIKASSGSMVAVCVECLILANEITNPSETKPRIKRASNGAKKSRSESRPLKSLKRQDEG